MTNTVSNNKQHYQWFHATFKFKLATIQNEFKHQNLIKTGNYASIVQLTKYYTLTCLFKSTNLENMDS